MAYLRDRLIQAAITLYGIVTLGFIFNKMMPGSPVTYLSNQVRQNPTRYGLSRNPTQREINQVVEQMINIDPDKSLIEAYIGYMEQVFLHLDFGESIFIDPGANVMQLILEAAPWTIFLSIVGLLYGLIVGILLGSIMAYFEGTKFDIGMSVTMILNGAIPYYVAAIFLLYVFGFQFGWFPTGGRVNPDATAGMNWPWIASVFRHAALPSLSFIIVGFGGSALGIRANSIRLIGSDYIKVARLRGLSTYRISTSYLARNAILPMYTGIVIGLGGILGGSVIMEQIFSYPGMGLLMFNATVSRDFPVLMGGFTITSFLFVIGTLIADFTYSIIDPRADLRGME
ncbi:ABC transporter permease [Halosimplex amylolyticum]|uniref:ABC transporter permease n=1 Tax=Halosimplex amylolyticum TaxID=3396616 RepID=UPI003F543CDD